MNGGPDQPVGRRTLLQTLGISGLIGVAGCTGGSSEDSDGEETRASTDSPTNVETTVAETEFDEYGLNPDGHKLREEGALRSFQDASESEIRNLSGAIIGFFDIPALVSKMPQSDIDQWRDRPDTTDQVTGRGFFDVGLEEAGVKASNGYGDVGVCERPKGWNYDETLDVLNKRFTLNRENETHLIFEGSFIDKRSSGDGGDSKFYTERDVLIGLRKGSPLVPFATNYDLNSSMIGDLKAAYDVAQGTALAHDISLANGDNQSNKEWRWVLDRRGDKEQVLLRPSGDEKRDIGFFAYLDVSEGGEAEYIQGDLYNVDGKLDSRIIDTQQGKAYELQGLGYHP